MKKLRFLILPLFLISQLCIQMPVQAKDHVVTFYNNAIVGSGFTIDFSTTEDLSGLELLSAQQLRFSDASGTTVLVNATVTQVISTSTFDVTFNSSANLNGLTIDQGQYLKFVETSSSAPAIVYFVVEDLILH